MPKRGRTPKLSTVLTRIWLEKGVPKIRGDWIKRRDNGEVMGCCVEGCLVLNDNPRACGEEEEEMRVPSRFLRANKAFFEAWGMTLVSVNDERGEVDGELFDLPPEDIIGMCKAIGE